MKIAFRVDASIQIGTGHVMRCLTLADELTRQGHKCQFICREHEGHLGDLVVSKGYELTLLPGFQSVERPQNDSSDQTYSNWLGCDWQTDAQQCSEILSRFKPDWLVVDHYALYFRWEDVSRRYVRRILVIDDLADRVHSCDLLLDQNLGRNEADYQDLVPDHCSLLIGPRFALLRPEFARLREYSLKRREHPKLRKLLITMGGVDKDNATGMVLEVLKGCHLPADCRIDVVMGTNAPWLGDVQEMVTQMPWPTEISVNVDDMAQRMADADLAIGAAGSTSWERCCLGLPTLMAVLADNQQSIGEALHQSGAAVLLGVPSNTDFNVKCAERFTLLHKDKINLKSMTQAAAAITEGTGAQLVISRILSI